MAIYFLNTYCDYVLLLHIFYQHHYYDEFIFKAFIEVLSIYNISFNFPFIFISLSNHLYGSVLYKLILMKYNYL